MRASLLGTLIEGKIRLSESYTPADILKDLQLEIGGRYYICSVGGPMSMRSC